jgi:hypothetical protein
MLPWIDPVTSKRKSKSAPTAAPDKAEDARMDLESDLNNVSPYPSSPVKLAGRFSMK